MATSNSTDFNQTRDEIIKDALILVSGIEDNEEPDQFQIDYASRAMNRMFKAWATKGLKLWAWKEGELYLARGEDRYTIGPDGDYEIERPLEMDNFRCTIDGHESPTSKVGRNTYMQQVNKESRGSNIVMAYYDPQLDHGVLNVWPTPDNGRVSLKFDYKTTIQDMDSSTDNAQFPTEWLEAIVYNLAMRLLPMYEVGGEDAKTITAMAMKFLEDISEEDHNNDSVEFGFGG